MKILSAHPMKYKMPNPVPLPEGYVEYWYADAEEKARTWDIAYIKKVSERALREIGTHRARRHGIDPAAEDGEQADKPAQAAGA
jgi:hypothetical protein